MKTCIIIPSHINHVSRTKMLISCLQSLLNQTFKISIYLSISFETELDKTLFNKFIGKNNLINNLINDLLFIIYREKKTSQFRHIEKVVNKIKDEYNYVMFCDDDDTYENNRVEIFMSLIRNEKIPKDKIFVGVCEGTKHEYWSYCVNVEFITRFMSEIKINNYDYYIDYKMCDMLFMRYLKCLDNKHYFAQTDKKLYNYNKVENSITGKIKINNDINHKRIQQREINFKIFIQSINKQLEENIEDHKDNVMLFYLWRQFSFEQILTFILKENYKYKNKINKTILERLKFEYDNIKNLYKILCKN